jgi:hypothetical protein
VFDLLGDASKESDLIVAVFAFQFVKVQARLGDLSALLICFNPSFLEGVFQSFKPLLGASPYSAQGVSLYQPFPRKCGTTTVISHATSSRSPTLCLD